MNVSIVIPAFNESRRLPATIEKLMALNSAGEFKNITIHEVIVIDDGSSDNTVEICKNFAKKYSTVKVLESGKNFGKGHAVRIGLMNVKGEYALMADADMATPWTELNKLRKYLESSTSHIAIGSRDLPESDIRTHQSFLREHLGKLFNFFVRSITGLKFKDTQCGFKLFNMAYIKPILSELKVNRFAWDVEFLFRAKAHGLTMIEVPVQWEHQNESRVNPIKDGLQMAWTVIKIRVGIL